MKLTITLMILMLMSTCILHGQHHFFDHQLQALKSHEYEILCLMNQPMPPIIEKNTALLKFGDQSEKIITIRKRLILWNDLSKNDTAAVFDSSLHKAIAHFQYRHGLQSTGFLNRECIQLLNKEPIEIFKIVRLNIQRLEHYRSKTNGFVVIVNIPEYMFWFYKNDTLVRKSKVIVGKRKTPTKIFNSTIDVIVLCPYWNIPTSIMKNEIMPEILHHQTYMQKNHIEWVGNRMRQLPGMWNALGLVKFVIPNKYGIFLHDTPNKKLFEKAKRAESHGCIRLENAINFAADLLDSTEHGGKYFDDIFKRNHQVVIRLEKTVWVYVVYLTSSVDEQGALMLWNDVYGIDAK